MFIAGLGKTKLTVLLVHKVRSVPVVCIVAFLKTNNQYCEQTETCLEAQLAVNRSLDYSTYKKCRTSPKDHQIQGFKSGTLTTKPSHLQ